MYDTGDQSAVRFQVFISSASQTYLLYDCSCASTAYKLINVNNAFGRIIFEGLNFTGYQHPQNLWNFKYLE